MSRRNEYIAIFMVLVLSALEVSRDVHFAVYHRHAESGSNEIKHSCCSINALKTDEEQLHQPMHSCPYEHVKFPPFKFTHVNELRYVTVRVAVLSFLFIENNFAKVFDYSYPLRAPPFFQKLTTKNWFHHT